MPEYEFEIQGYTKVTVEADNAEAARMMLIVDQSLYEEEIMRDCGISDGEEVK
jgi:flagellar assembly factor FliW